MNSKSTPAVMRKGIAVANSAKAVFSQHVISFEEMMEMIPAKQPAALPNAIPAADRTSPKFSCWSPSDTTFDLNRLATSSDRKSLTGDG
jgi:hypothetical protein